jgi:hypothetical protein
LVLKRQKLGLTQLFNTFHDDLRDKFTAKCLVTQNLTLFHKLPTVLTLADIQQNKVALAYLHKQQERQLRGKKARSNARLPVASRAPITVAPSLAKAATPETLIVIPVTPSTKRSVLQDDKMTDALCTEENLPGNH